MWEYCGVVRTADKLEEGLRKIENLKESVKHLDVRPDSEGYEDLMLAFDLEASIMSAEATVLGAQERKESRGSHQRSDYPSLQKNQEVNYCINLLENGSLKISSQPLKNFSEDLRTVITNTKDIQDFSGMLLE